MTEWYELVDWVQVGIQFGAGVLAVGLGLVGAMWWDRRKKTENEKITRNNTLDSLLDELEDAKKGVDRFMKDRLEWDQDNLDFKGEKPWILKPAYETAINSGNFSLLERSLQTEISKAYLSIDAVNFYCNLVRTFANAANLLKGYQITAEMYCKKVFDNVNKLDGKLQKLIPKIKEARKS